MLGPASSTPTCAKVPRLAEIVLPDLAITGTATETFAVKVVGYAIGLGTARPGAVGRHGHRRHPLGFEIPAVGVLVLGGAGAVSPVRRPPPGGRTSPTPLLPLAVHLRVARVHGHGRGHGVVERPGGRGRRCRRPTGPWPRSPRRCCGPRPIAGSRGKGSTASPPGSTLPDLADLARAMAQAGDGARIRDSLEAKAQSLRLKETAALEDAAAGRHPEDAAARRAPHGRLRRPRLLPRPRRLHRRPHLILPDTTTTERNPMPLSNRTLQDADTELTAMAQLRRRVGPGQPLSFLRAYCRARLTPVLGDEARRDRLVGGRHRPRRGRRHRHRRHRRDQAHDDGQQHPDPVTSSPARAVVARIWPASGRETRARRGRVGGVRRLPPRLLPPRHRRHPVRPVVPRQPPGPGGGRAGEPGRLGATAPPQAAGSQAAYQFIATTGARHAHGPAGRRAPTLAGDVAQVTVTGRTQALIPWFDLDRVGDERRPHPGVPDQVDSTFGISEHRRMRRRGWPGHRRAGDRRARPLARHRPHGRLGRIDSAQGDVESAARAGVQAAVVQADPQSPEPGHRRRGQHARRCRAHVPVPAGQRPTRPTSSPAARCRSP